MLAATLATAAASAATAAEAPGGLAAALRLALLVAAVAVVVVAYRSRAHRSHDALAPPVSGLNQVCAVGRAVDVATPANTLSH
jgi:hypothetical protein